MMHLSPQQLSAHLDSALHGASLQLVEGHLESCERCRDELAALTLQDHMLGEALRGDTDRELFDLIGLRVQSVVHPQRARALEKSIAELERTREERRRHAEEVARRVTELRQHGPGDDERPMDQSTRPSHEFPPVPESTVPNADDFSPQFTPLDPPAPAFHPEPEAPMSAAAGLRRRALDEARTRAEAEARAFALESERAQEAAERHALEQAASRARLEAVARRKAEEDGRARAAASARIEAEHLARAAEAAMVEAENSARDATAAKARAEARAAAAEEAHRQAQRKAEEARRLEARLAEPPESETHAAEVFLLADSEPSMLTPEAVAAYRVQPLDEDDEVPPARVRARRQPPPAREPKRSPALALTASFLILAVAFWFAVGRQLWPGPGTNAPTTAAIEPHASGDAGIAPAPAAPEAPAPAPAADESRQRARRTPAGEPAKRTEPPLAESLPGGGVAPSAGEDGTSADATEEEPVDEPSVDLGLLCGTVRDEEHHAIAGARVMMADVGVVVVTDRTGRFCLTAPRGARPLSVIALGFGTHRETVTVGRRTSELSVTLRATPAVSHAPSR